MGNGRTMRITGKGQVKVRPNVTRITMTLEGTQPAYDEALRRSAQDTEQVRELLNSLGFDGSDLKTLSFQVDTEYEVYQEERSVTVQKKFVGYKFRHRMKVEFPSDNDRLGRILYGLAHCPASPEFGISYTVKDQEAVRNELLGKAVADAKVKAAVLAQAAGVSLKEIQSIDHSWGAIDFEVRPMGRAMAAGKADGMAAPLCASYDLDVEPDDIEVSDTVTVVWEIQ